MVYDITNPDSLLNLHHWHELFVRYSDVFPTDSEGRTTKPALVLVGNKSDLMV